MSIYLSSDLHINHAAIIGYSNRPYSSVEHMNEEIIKNWNSVVSPKDTVYFLGDFCMGDRKLAGEYLKRLNGASIKLIAGNHDTRVTRSFFSEVYPYIKYPLGTFDPETHQAEYFLMIHNPYAVKNLPSDVIKGIKFVCCGHVHEKWRIKGKGDFVETYIAVEHSDEGFVVETPFVNVGLDVNGYKPILLDDIIEEMKPLHMSKKK